MGRWWAGGNYCLALRSDGTIAFWGTTNNGIGNVPVGLSNLVGIAAGGEYSLALKPDGSVLSWGFDRQGDTVVPPGLTNVQSVTAGNYFSLALIGNSPPSANIPVRNPTISQNMFSVTVPTQCGLVYRLEYKNALSDPEWLKLPLVPGNSREQTLFDPSPIGDQRFYRVRSW